MQILIHVRGKDGKRRRVSLQQWESDAEVLTVYNNRGIPVVLTRPKMRWSGVTEIARADVVGLWKDCWNE